MKRIYLYLRRRIAIWHMRRVFWKIYDTCPANLYPMARLHHAFKILILYNSTLLGDESLNLQDDLDYLDKAIPQGFQD